MNYIREINAFYDWLETNTLTDSAINLWHALMHVANKAGWPEEFAVASSTLQSKTGLKKDAVITARNRLQMEGRITFRSRTGQQSAIYHMIPLNNCVGLNDTNPVTKSAQTPTLTPSQTPSQTPSINKQNINQTKQKEYTPEFEEWYAAYPNSKAKADSFRNFEKVRKAKGIDYIWLCTRNYIAFLNINPDKKPYTYSSNNFFGEKQYCQDFEKVVSINEPSSKSYAAYRG